MRYPHTLRVLKTRARLSSVKGPVAYDGIRRQLVKCVVIPGPTTQTTVKRNEIDVPAWQRTWTVIMDNGEYAMLAMGDGVPSLLPETGYHNPFGRDMATPDAIDGAIAVAGAEILSTERYAGFTVLTVGRIAVNDRL